MKKILALFIALICGVASAESPIDGEWRIAAVNQNWVQIEITEPQIVSIKNGKIKFLNPDGSVMTDWARVVVNPDFDSRTRGTHDVTVAFGTKHYGRWVMFPIYPKDYVPSDRDLFNPPKPIGMKLITALNNKPDGDRPPTFSPGDNIDVIEWVRFFEMEE